MTNKTRRIINILDVVKDIADPEYQNRAWVKCEINWPCSFGELITRLYDDCDIEEFLRLDGKKYNLTNLQIEALYALVCALNKFCDKPEIYLTHEFPLIADESKILKDPEWHKIRKQAQMVLEYFGKIKFDLSDKDWWLNFILQSIYRYSDIVLQRKMWADKTKVFFSTPLDMYKLLFDSNDFDRFIDEYAEKFGLTKQQIETLHKFRIQLKQTPFATTHFENILNNSDWQKIQARAKEVVDVFHFSMNG
jgi:hypothetical protein